MSRRGKEHHYLSTACYHDIHSACRLICKYCPEKCLCKCHGLHPQMEIGGTVRPPSPEELGEQ